MALDRHTRHLRQKALTATAAPRGNTGGGHVAVEDTGWKPVLRDMGWKPVLRDTGWKPVLREGAG